MYRVAHPSARDPKRSRVFVVVSKQVLIDSGFPTVICAPFYSAYQGLESQVLPGTENGLKHESSIHCDESNRECRDPEPGIVKNVHEKPEVAG
uniref:Uncharacterized protein n=1 Tax=Candidatus Kentrum eta TaxID=2126337 RepID=A0A450VJI5_9GAMM|nr:MAG: hypothetical protein BECKH772A_GA0070896_102165 [Candidatus Kentron sp. H]VFK01250.1 MAG: hypothetical protein BECKH772B_GA0070898_102235 [Candidatus Kentron sp. H]VFK04887.1 MAG: hypothetical protein BECKH772C_GA0070978_102175 [Candidatus Kentron sp. H]